MNWYQTDFRNHEVVVNDKRLGNEVIPKFLYVYKMRHGDDGDWSIPVTVEECGVMVNHFGTLISGNPIDMDCGDHTELEYDESEELGYSVGEFDKKINNLEEYSERFINTIEILPTVEIL